MDNHRQRPLKSGSAPSPTSPNLPQPNDFPPHLMTRHLPPADQPRQQQSPTAHFVPQPPGVPVANLQRQVLSPGLLVRNGGQAYEATQPPQHQQGPFPPQAYWPSPMAQQLSIPQMSPLPVFPQQQPQQYPVQGFPPHHPQQLPYMVSPNAYYQYAQGQNGAYNWSQGGMVQQMHPVQQAHPSQPPHGVQPGFSVQNMSYQSYMPSNPVQQQQQQHAGHQLQQHVQQTPPSAKWEPGGHIEKVFKKHSANGILELRALASALDSLNFPRYTYEGHLQIFKAADKDCSGNISPSEFSTIVQQLIGTSAFSRANNGHSLDVSGFRKALEILNIKLEYSVLLNYFGKADDDQGCTIEEKEFTTVLSTIAFENNITVDMMWRHVTKMPKTGITRKMADSAFSWADSTNKGYLDIAMLMIALKKLNMDNSYEEVRRLFPKFDRDESGHISRNEFVAHFAPDEAIRSVPKAKYSEIKGKR